MTSIKGCIFDLDGVIVNTTKYHYLAWKRLARRLGFDFSEKENEQLKGVSRIHSLEILLKIGNIHCDMKTKAILAEQKNNWYLEYISKIDKADILPGVEEFIRSLKYNNIRTALGSASKNAIIILSNTNMIEYFDVIIDGNKTKMAKPDPEVFLLCAQELGLKPLECVVFEDAEAGITAAKKAGMFAIGVGSSSVLKNADKIINGFENTSLEILKI
jgi:beta-phosphoglucomutase